MNRSNEIHFNHSLLTEHYMPRPRVDEIFDKATRCKLVYVVAGAGYGKTQAVHHYADQQEDAIVRWVQLTDSDNVGSRYWESLIHNISFDNPDLAVKLRELGFPETVARFKQFTEILKTTEHRSHKIFLVLDDFHLIHSEQALTFAERCAHLNIPGACVIIISRQEPEINAVSLFSKGKASMITENELCFTDSELAEFLRQCDIPFSAKELPQYIDATKGWALAIKLLSLVLKKEPKSFEFAIDAMKQNIFKLFETEAWSDFPEDVKKTIAQFSLVSDLPLPLLREVFNDDSLTQYIPQLASFIWFDSFTSHYRIHPLYLEFVQDKQPILSDEEKQDTYRRAAQWCSENSFYMDAMRYYAKSYQYERMIQTLLSYPLRVPYDTCDYFLNILRGLDPNTGEGNNQSFLLLKNLFIPLFLVGSRRFEEAREIAFQTIREWENEDTPFSVNLLYTAHSILAYADMFTCLITHQYSFAEYLKKSVEYYKKTTIPTLKITGAFDVADIRTYACLVGEGASLPKLDEFLETIREAALYIAERPHNMYYGYDELAVCELAFFKNQLESAKKHAHNTIFKAREKKQYSIEAAAEHYLLRIAIAEGNGSLVKEILKQLSDHLDNPDFWNRQLLYDLITGSFYTQIGLTDMVPAWFTMEEKESASEARVPIRELVVNVRYNIARKRYDQALTLLSKSYPRDPQDRFVFGELAFSLLTAVARVSTGDDAGAIADFERAYELSFGGELEMLFVELGKNLHPLVVAATKHTDCSIPEEWLKKIDRKAYIYAKKAAVITNALKEKRKTINTVSLSERELEVLNDLYHGLSREEIAENRYLSINTVKPLLKSIYIKLNAKNNVDAVRIALENKLLE